MTNKKTALVIISFIIVSPGIVLGALKLADNFLEKEDRSMSGEMLDIKKQDSSKQTDLMVQTDVTMDIKDYAYSKPNIIIKKGTKVTWTNQDSIKHNVMKDHDNNDSTHNSPKPSEVNPDVFAGPLLAKGESYSYTFGEVGIYPYHCSQHSSMKGSVEVVE